MSPGKQVPAGCVSPPGMSDLNLPTHGKLFQVLSGDSGHAGNIFPAVRHFIWSILQGNTRQLINDSGGAGSGSSSKP